MKKFIDIIRPYFTKPYLKRYFLYLLAIILLGTSVAMIQSTNAGMSAWDALNRNFYEGIPLEYRYLTPIVAVILVGLAYLIEWKKPKLIMLFPIVISFFIGLIIDILLLFIPVVIDLPILWTVLYLIVAIILVAIGLNIIIYCNFSLPALDQFCMAISKRFKVSFGLGKYIGEAIALILTVIVGLYYKSGSENFYLGFTTIYYLLFLGFVIDMFKRPIRKLLNDYPIIDLFADDMQTEDINKNNIRVASRVIIEKENQIMIIHHKKDDFYMLPGGGKKFSESLVRCLKREVLEETGYSIKNIEETVIIKEYFIDSSYENHYFKAKVKNDLPNLELVNLTEAEKKADMEVKWIEKNELLDLLNNYDSSYKYGTQIMWREFLGLMNSL